ncbi:MAG: hypothetical protein AB2689_21700 [Candidatus Thiodiazotropha taylori]
MNDAVQQYIDTHSKSQGLGFVLTLLFGPLGLFYSSWVAALILCVIAIASAASIIGPVICWILAIIIGFAAVSKHNEKVKAAAALGVRE